MALEALEATNELTHVTDNVFVTLVAICRLTVSNEGIKSMALKVLETMKVAGAPAVTRCILERSTQLRSSKTPVERLHLLYLVDNTLSVSCCVQWECNDTCVLSL